MNENLLKIQIHVRPIRIQIHISARVTTVEYQQICPGSKSENSTFQVSGDRVD